MCVQYAEVVLSIIAKTRRGLEIGGGGCSIMGWSWKASQMIDRSRDQCQMQKESSRQRQLKFNHEAGVCLICQEASWKSVWLG